MDKNFYIALAYTSATEKNLDILSFRQKVQDNQDILDADDRKKPLPKVQVIDRSKLGF